MDANDERLKVKNVFDIGDYLKKKEKEVTCMDHLLGPELFTYPQYISSSRAIMFANHLKQIVTLNNPEFPRLFTNYENTFGNLSSSLHKTKANVTVYKIISKVPWKIIRRVSVSIPISSMIQES